MKETRVMSAKNLFLNEDIPMIRVMKENTNAHEKSAMWKTTRCQIGMEITVRRV